MNYRFFLLFLLFWGYGIYAQVGIGTGSPNASSALDITSTTKGFLPPRMSTVQRNAIVSPVAGLFIYNTTTNCLEWYTGSSWFNNGCSANDSTDGTGDVTAYACNTASSGTMTVGFPVSGVTQTITATVTTVGTYSISATANGVTFSGSGTFAGTGAQNIVLTASGTPTGVGTNSFVLNTTPSCSFTRTTGTAGPVGGLAICDGSQPTTVVNITSLTGKIWMDRNLGASRAGTSATDFEAYGCLYQWGRGNDGHASINWTSSIAGTPVNGSTGTLSGTDTPGNNLFITSGSLPFDWRSPQNNSLWQGVGGINNPCPVGYRVPTHMELLTESSANGITNSAMAYASIYKFVLSGRRSSSSSAMDSTGFNSYYASSTVYGPYTTSLGFSAATTNIADDNRAYGFSVRCIKD